MQLNNYFEFADDDCKYFLEDYNKGRVANYMGAMAQNICERYMKHLVESYIQPTSREEQLLKNSMLKTHSLNRLRKYLDDELGFQFSSKTISAIKIIDGFYFSTRYPGDDSIILDKSDIEDCAMAVQGCREEITTYINEKEKKIHKEDKTLFERAINGENILEKDSLHLDKENIRSKRILPEER